jgi:hypothetical protein
MSAAWNGRQRPRIVACVVAAWLIVVPAAATARQASTDYAGRGIRVVGVVCECDDPTEVAAYRTEFGIEWPVHLDTSFTLAEALDATTTPEVVLVDRDRRIRYA